MTSTPTTRTTVRYIKIRWRRRVSLATVMAGALVSVTMAVSVAGTGDGAVDKLTRLTRTSASAPAIAVSQTTGTTVCESSSITSTCSNADLYGGRKPLVPGQTRTVAMRFTNTGQQDIDSRTLVAGNCVTTATKGALGGSDPAVGRTLCDTMRVSIFEGAVTTGKPLYAGTPAAIPTTLTLSPLAANATQTYIFRISLPADADRTQGQAITQALTWNNNF